MTLNYFPFLSTDPYISYPFCFTYQRKKRKKCFFFAWPLPDTQELDNAFDLVGVLNLVDVSLQGHAEDFVLSHPVDYPLAGDVD